MVWDEEEIGQLQGTFLDGKHPKYKWARDPCTTTDGETEQLSNLMETGITL